MATKKQPVLSKLLEVAQAATPENPLPSSADKTYLRSLKKRGFTDAELIALAAKAGLKVTVEMLVVKPKKPKTEVPATAQTA